MTQLGKLQRKIRFQQWKYAVVALLISFAGIAVTLFNPASNQQIVLVGSTTPKPETSPPIRVDFFQILTTLDDRRREAFKKQDLSALLEVNEKDSLQALRDERILKRIIKEDLTIELVKSTITSVIPLAPVTFDSKDVTLEVIDVSQGIERFWNIEISKQVDGSWRIKSVTKVRP